MYNLVDTQSGWTHRLNNLWYDGSFLNNPVWVCGYGMYMTIFSIFARAFRSVVDRLLCMLKVKGSNPLMSTFLFLLFAPKYLHHV